MKQMPDLKASCLTALIFLMCLPTARSQFFALQEQYPLLWLADTTVLMARPAITDIDGDGDLDIFIGDDLGKFQFYENVVNIPGEREFVRSQEIHPFDLQPEAEAIFPTFTDIDNDGDMDLLAGDQNGSFHYYENTGTAIDPSFQSVVFNPFGLAPIENKMLFPAFADMDGDGDIDLLAGDAEGVLYYFENAGTDALPSFSVPIANPFNLDTLHTYAAPVLGDFDNDEDIDLILGERAGKLIYIENRGDKRFADFGGAVFNPIPANAMNTPFLPTAADLDRDGDMDLLVLSLSNMIFYYINVSAGSIGVDEENPAFLIKITPNPAQDYLQLETREIIKSIEIRRLNGEPVIQIDKPEDNQLFISSLEPESYVIEIVNVRGEKVLMRFEKER